MFDGAVGPWFLPTFLAATGLAHLDCAVLLPSVDRCVARVATRRDHGFTDEGATRHMHDQFASATVEARHVLVDPPDDVEAAADLVSAAQRHGTLRVDA